jgi:hypothetical protein
MKLYYIILYFSIKDKEFKREKPQNLEIVYNLTLKFAYLKFIDQGRPYNKFAKKVLWIQRKNIKNKNLLRAKRNHVCVLRLEMQEATSYNHKKYGAVVKTISILTEQVRQLLKAVSESTS